MPRNRIPWTELWPDLLAVLFFGLLFLPYPLNDHFPGNCDFYLGMALSDSYVAAVRELITGIPSGSAMWPDDIHRLGEATPLAGLWLASLRGIGLSWAWIIHIMLVVVFAGNTMAMRRCVAALTGDRAAGIVVGFGFSFTNTLWAHVDDIIVTCWIIPALVIWLVLRAHDKNQTRCILLAGALGAAQAYVAMYVFVFQSIWLGAWGIGLLYRADRRGRRGLLTALALYIGLALPLVIFHAGARHNVVPDISQIPWTSVHAATGLQPSDWVSTLPDNIVHSAEPITDTQMSPHWVNLRRRVSFGWLWPFLACLAFAVRGAPRIALAVTAGFGLLFSLGGAWPPSTVMVEVVPWLRYLRVVSRAHLLVLFAASIGVGFVIARARRLVPARPFAIGLSLVLFVHALENIPVPMPGHASLPMRAPEALVAALADAPDAVVLHLPADDALYMNGGSDPLFAYNRELLYMLWQPQHRHHTVNGLSGYLTPNRIALNGIVGQLPSPGAIESLARIGVTHIAYHPRLAVTADERRYSALDTHPRLRVMTHGPEVTLWQLVPLQESQ